MPSGREEAIETLVDMDPEGNFFRAARVLVRFSRLLFCGSRSDLLSLFGLFPVVISLTLSLCN
jgi:hypothetical protein